MPRNFRKLKFWSKHKCSGIKSAALKLTWPLFELDVISLKMLPITDWIANFWAYRIFLGENLATDDRNSFGENWSGERKTFALQSEVPQRGSKENCTEVLKSCVFFLRENSLNLVKSVCKIIFFEATVVGESHRHLLRLILAVGLKRRKSKRKSSPLNGF